MSDGTREARVGDVWTDRFGRWTMKVQSVGSEMVLVRWTHGPRRGWETSMPHASFRNWVTFEHARLVTEGERP